jgi:hypothetical protein
MVISDTYTLLQLFFDQSKDEHVENHYCDIDESAMIKTVNLSEKSYENECML